MSAGVEYAPPGDEDVPATEEEEEEPAALEAPRPK